MIPRELTLDEARDFARFIWKKEIHLAGQPDPGDFMQDEPHQTFDFGWTFVLKEEVQAPRPEPGFEGFWARYNEEYAVLVTKIGGVIFPSKEPFGCTMEQHVRQLRGMADRERARYETTDLLPAYFADAKKLGHPPGVLKR